MEESTSFRFSDIARRLARGRLVPALGGAGLLVGLILWAAQPRSYEAEATILPVSEGAADAGSQLRGIAGTFGISLPGPSVPESHLFPAILRSGRVIRAVMHAPLDSSDASRGTLYDRVVDRDAAENRREELAVTRVRREVLDVALDEETAIVRLTVRLRDPVAASRTAALFLRELSDYLRTERSATAREKRLFVESRREEAERALKMAEEELRDFRERNRSTRDSPDLLLQEDRLLRSVRMQEEVFLELTRQFEIARIEEKEATPVLQVLDPPRESHVPAAPKLSVLTGLGLLLGLLAGSFIALLREAPPAGTT